MLPHENSKLSGKLSQIHGKKVAFMVAFLRATSPAQPASKEGYNLRRGSKLLIIAVLKILIIAVLVDTLCLFSSVNDEVHNNANWWKSTFWKTILLVTFLERVPGKRHANY